MNDSRITELLMHSRSRHQPVRSPQLNKISKQWQQQKKRSRQSNNDVKKMLREMRYFTQLNQRLNKEVSKGRKKLKEAEKVRERHNEDLRQKNELEKLRLNNVLKNHDLAAKIKQDRQRRLNAVQRNMYLKRSLADSSRSESRRLRQLKQEHTIEDYLTNKSKIQSILEFQVNSREKSIMRKESQLMMHIRHHEQEIERERKSIKMRQHQSMQIRNKLKSLTQTSNSKLQVLDDIKKSMDKYKTPRRSPYYQPIKFKKEKLHKNIRYYTEKPYTDKSQQESTIFVSQHYYEQ